MWLYNVMFTEIGVKSKRMDVIISSNVYEDRCYKQNDGCDYIK